MLRSGEQPSLQMLMQKAAEFIANYVTPREEREHEYLQQFAKANYRPDLLFGATPIADAALVNPEALWKLQNLRQMPQHE